jgi:hypothetical protein
MPGATIEATAFSDNLGFSYATTGASRAFISGPTTIRGTAHQQVFQATIGGALSRNPGVGARIDAERDLGRGFGVSASGGLESYSMVGTVPVYGFGLSANAIAGISLAIEARHGSAAQSAQTLAAVQSRAQSDMVSVSASRSLHAWSFWLRGERENITSLIGGVQRVAASGSVRRELTSRLAAFASMSGLSINQPSPQLPGFGSLIWAPKSYVEPGLGLAYHAAQRNGWSFGGDVTGGYAFVNERQNDQRFPQGPRPTAGLGAEILYSRGRWDAALNARAGGAVGSGYRSGTVGIRATYRIGR